jgi:hypothetical protein
MVNYQGTVRKNGTIFDGTGYFKFAVMNSPTGPGTVNYWAHDGTAQYTPTTYITLTVINGLFNVLLGDATNILSMTEVMSDTVFQYTDSYLRVWFSDTPNNFQAMEPNQRFASVAYALRCTTCEYAKTYNETDPVFTSSPAAVISTTDISNWNTAHGWGDHALAGYDTTDDPWTFSTALDTHVLNRNVGIDVPNPSALLHIRDNAGSPQAQLILEQLGPTPGSAYQEYHLVPPAGPPNLIFSTGVDSADNNFKTTNQPNLASGAPSSQGDGVTMLQAHPNGILDFNNQSRARASLNHGQNVMVGWTPIEFDDDMTLPGGYDQQNEFTLWTSTPTPAFFQATEEGYYQVHARTVFDVLPQQEPQGLGGYVSIAIYVNGVMYAQGNNLQILMSVLPPEEWHWLTYNNAPNVSDVVYLMPGDQVEIYVYQDAVPGGIPLGVGPSQTYVSIHKDS